jgi:hypothetical protein
MYAITDLLYILFLPPVSVGRQSRCLNYGPSAMLGLHGDASCSTRVNPDRIQWETNLNKFWTPNRLFASANSFFSAARAGNPSPLAA